MRKFLRLRNIFIGIGIVLLIALGVEFQDDYRKSGKFRTMQDPISTTEQVDLTGLRDLPVAGGPILPLSTLKERLAPFKGDIIVVDGILSKHGYVNSFPSTYLGYFHNTPSWHHLLWRLVYTGTPRAHPEQIVPPFEEAKSHGIQYVNLQIGSKFKSPDKAIDDFVNLFDTLPPHTKVYFHCHHGKGRTSMMLVMADIMKNALKVSLDDIVKRQYLLGSVDLFDTTSWTGGTYATKTLEDRKRFIQKFYAFICQRKADGIQRWSEWNSLQENERRTLGKNLKKSSLYSTVSTSSFLRKQEPRIITYPQDKSISTGLLRSPCNDASGDVQKRMKCDISISQGCHYERSEATQCKQFKPEGLAAFFKSIVSWVPAFARMTSGSGGVLAFIGAKA